MYKYWENWSYLDAFYFIFITITTIGFGDVVPNHPYYFMVTSIYILLGLSLVAMVINIYREFVSTTLDKAQGTMWLICESLVNFGMRITGNGRKHKYKTNSEIIT